MKISRRFRIILALLTVLTCALVVIAGCRKPDKSETDPLSDYARDTRTIAQHEDEYIGAAACAECHRKEFDAQSRTFHAASLRAMTGAKSGQGSPPVGRIADSLVRVSLERGQYFFELPTGKDSNGNTVPGVISTIEQAVGAGKVGTVYVWHDHAVGNMGVTKHAWFPHAKAWRVARLCTDVGLEDQGVALKGSQVEECVRCHSNNRSDAPATWQSELSGVTCESCHGPGGAHAQAARLHRLSDDARIELTRRATAAETNSACGTCHRIERNVPPVAPSLSAGGQGEYAGHALAFGKSRCFLESNGKLSCVTCHDPHQNLSADRSRYESLCVSCHTPPRARPVGLPAAQTVRAKFCPVSPSAGCVRCHMPQHGQLDPVAAFQPMIVTSHYIGIYDKQTLRGAQPRHDASPVGATQ